MKNRNNLNAAGAALAILLLAGLQNLSATAPSSDVSLVWNFGTAANAAAPDSAVGVTGASLATVTPGLFAEGWLNQLTGLPGANGVWDLGNNGNIALNNSAGLTGATDHARNITVRVVQYHDSGGMYDQATVVSVPGATLESTTTSTLASAGNFGDWVVQESRWKASANTAVNTILVQGATAAKKGSVIDQVSVLAQVAAPSAQLTIQKVGGEGGQVQISWPSDFAGMELQASSNPGNANGWSKVQQTPQLSGGRYSVTVEASGAKFYRLMQP